MTTDAEAQIVIGHTVDAIGRTGAIDLSIGYLDDEPPHRWYATARYQGAKVSCDIQPDPMAAVLGLYAMLAAGGTCPTCDRPVAVAHSDPDAPLCDGARMRRGIFEARPADPDGVYCVRRYDPDDGWPGCTTGGPR